MFRFTLAAVASLVLLTAAPALAGPPLICFPFDTHGAKSLPMGTKDWHDTDPAYDTSKLIVDTLALLTPNTPVIARMETIRRATIYAAKQPPLGQTLLAAFEQRARNAKGVDAALADFDFGYMVETYRQASWAFKGALPSVHTIDGYQIVLKARALHPDPEIDHAAELIRGSKMAQ